MTPEAERFNGWAAMLGIIAAFGAYATTGQIIPLSLMTDFQAALLFPFIPVGIYLLIEFMLERTDDDDDQGGWRVDATSVQPHCINIYSFAPINNMALLAMAAIMLGTFVGAAMMPQSGDQDA